MTVINDTLDFSKIESGRMKLESRPFNVRNCDRQRFLDLGFDEYLSPTPELGGVRGEAYCVHRSAA
jgi:hypothetical protein